MNLLRGLLRLPWFLLLGLWLLLGFTLKVAGWWLEQVFGITWQAPQWLLGVGAWLRRTGEWVRSHPRQSFASLASVAVVTAGSWYGYHWYQNLPRPPKPVQITQTVRAPEITDYSEDAIAVHPLRVEFSGSVAPIELVGKPAGKGIQMRPDLAGRWTWISDSVLEFQPGDDWPVGQEFSVRFDKEQAFAAHVLMAADRFEFASAPFGAEVANAEFYQDPEDAAQKKTIVQIHFSHAVDPLEFEKRVAVKQSNPVSGGPPIARKFAVNYDRKKLNAWIHSEPLAVPKDDATLTVGIEKGIRSARGGPGTPEPVSSSVALPGIFGLTINSVEPTLVDNERFEPEQVVLIETSKAVGEKDIAKGISAWVLPIYNPETKEEDRSEPYDWSYSSEVGEKILKQSERLDLEPIASEREFEALHSFKHHAAPGRYVFIKINKGLQSFGGYLLAAHSVNVLRVPEYPRMLRFMGDGALLAMSGDQRVSVVSRNLPGMKLEIARVLPEQIQHLVTMNYGSYVHPELGGLSEDNITERYQQKIAIGAGDPSKAHYEGVDLSSYLGSGNAAKRGVFILKVNGYNPAADSSAEPAPPADPDESGYEGEYEGDSEGESDDYSAQQDARLIVVTDLGLVVKKSLDGSRDVFVQSIHTGEPVAAANVQILGKNGQLLIAETTDSDGRAHFAALEAFTREKAPSLYLVKKGEDLSFLPFAPRDRRLDFSRFDIGGVNNARDAGQLSAYLFSDRGLYRPGETFHIGMITRAADWSRDLNGVPLQVEVVDPRGMSVDRRPIKLSGVGFEELNYSTAENSPTGSWTINLYIVKNDAAQLQIGSVTVQLKEFQPDRMKASARLSQQVAEGWVKPDDLSALVSLQNLFGTPATDRRVEATLTLSPSIPAFASFPDYRFFDPQRAKEGYSEPLGEKQTNEKGEALFPLDLAKYGTASYRLYFLAKGYEAESGRSVAAETGTLVSSLDYLVGIKTDGDLDYVKRDDQRLVKLIAIDPHAKLTAVDKLNAAIIERRYVSILTKQDSGVYKYESRLKQVPVSEAPLVIAADGNSYTLPTATPGNFALVIKNGRGEELNRVDYAVAGEANLSRSLERNAELQLALSKHDYAPGEEIEISVRAPYAGSGLITIERDRVYAHVWFKAATTGSVQKIRVPADFEGNGYVNVQYLRDPASDEIFMSPLSYGIAPFSVNRDARKDALNVATPNMIKPGDMLTMKVTTGVPSRVAVFAVDEGILQVARYKLGDPLDFFFKKRMLEVDTAQILDLVLPEFSKLAGMVAPGGDGDGMLGRHLNPFRKKHQPPVAYWSGIVDVKDERDLTWQVPEDFNGRLRVMAVAVASDRIGTFTGGTTVRGDFVLSPNAPQIVAPGDEFEVSVGVSNNLTDLKGKEIPVSVKLDPGKQIEILGPAEQVLQLGELREGVVLFKLRAKGEPGAATLTFSASNSDKSARLRAEVSVRPATPYRTEVRIGSLGQGKEDVGPLRTMYDRFAKRRAAVAFTPLVLGGGLATFLQDFQHRCTEQLVSQGMPALVLEKFPELSEASLNANSRDANGRDALSKEAGYAELIATLRSRQNAEGGFGLWTATPQAERFVSVYAMLFLIEARERGRAVPADMLASGNRYLGQLAADESDISIAGLRERAFAIYLLTRQGMVTTNQIAAVRQRLDERFPKQWQNESVAAYLGATLKMLKEDKLAANLIEGPERVLVRDAAEAEYHYERYYDPLVRDGATLYLLARHFPERIKTMSPKALQNLIRPVQQGLNNTLSSAISVLALEAYATQIAKTTEGALTISEVASGGVEKVVSKPNGIVSSAAFSAAAGALRIGNSADLSAWYTVTQSGFDRQLPSAERKEGFEIIREYTDANGKIIGQVQIGDEIDVHVKIRAIRHDGMGNLAIVDLLPGGFEPVLNIPQAATADDAITDGSEPNPDADDSRAANWSSPIGLGSSTWTPEYADIRDDRIVIYGTASSSVREFVYRIKATNAGNYVVPPAYGESMYDRTVQAQSKGGRIVVVRK